MKGLTLLAFLVAFLFGCGNNDQNDPSTKTGDHAGHNTAPEASPTMMTIMHKMDRDMQQVPLTNDPDRDFAAMMRAHHHSAVEMADLELAQGSDTALKRLAQQMKTDQQREIEAFDRFLQGGTKGEANERFASEFKGTMKAMDHSNYKESGSIDGEFIALMSAHHQSGIDMAKVYLKYGQNQELRNIAKNIIASQAEEIVLMKTLHKDEGGHSGH